MATPSTAYEFVMSDPVKNLKPGKSLQIRRHCMQGRNTREGSRRMQQGKRRRSVEDREEVLELQRALRPIKLFVSGMPPSESLIGDLALLRFAGPGIDSKARNFLFKAFAYSFANQALSPLDRCVEFDCLDSDSFELFLSDNAFLHSVMCASFAINDILNSQWNGKPGPQTLFHLRNALSLLQVKLRDKNVHQDESVLQVVLNLALLAGAFGEWPAAGTHFKGLHKLVQMRGHLEFLKGRPKLHFKLDRIDLARTLTTGRRPLFLDPAVSWDPIIPSPYLTLPAELYQPSPDWHPRLVNIFQDFQYLYWKLPYDWVIRQLGDAYTKAAQQLLQEDICLRVWLLMTVSFAVASPQKDWIREEWGKIYLELDHDWAGVKNQLMRVMWIESIHDGPGEIVFKQLEELKILTN
ncbi:hypothetical protein DL98DRAFT_434740 [Cadophora sp. DSE1049]|nr:hypothetical protein DL98DRAFT_434740 [Cadophora sp. DSE1049]